MPLSSTIFEHFLYMVEIVIACFIVEGFFRWSDSQKKKKFDLGCDSCQEVVPLNRTPDKSGYLCKSCMGAFLNEHAGEFSEEQITKVQKGYRRIKRSKSKLKR